MNTPESQLRKDAETAVVDHQPIAFWGEEREIGFDQIVIASAQAIDSEIPSTKAGASEPTMLSQMFGNSSS